MFRLDKVVARRQVGPFCPRPVAHCRCALSFNDIRFLSLVLENLAFEFRLLLLASLLGMAQPDLREILSSLRSGAISGFNNRALISTWSGAIDCWENERFEYEEQSEDDIK
jgi:hypothetical protein